ncbi:MAG: FkbM family methyltransferase [Bacteroidetes bacterium]|nr:FkbM family methyltransferase [Bacteroidota bacterium]
MDYPQQINNTDLIQKKVGNHEMLLDKTDHGISRVLIKKSNSRKWPREPEFMDIITDEISDGMVAFDLGANIGYITLIMADKVGESGHVYAVEPDPRNFAILEKNIRLNNYTERVSSYQTAISNRNGTCRFFLSRSSNLGSLHATGNTKGAIDVTAQTGDTFFSDKLQPDFIKMDIEGAEVEALEGMLKTLEKKKGVVKILMETHSMYYNPEDSLKQQLIKLFEIGFRAKYVITAGIPKPFFFASRGYEPCRIYNSGYWTRGVYTGISNEDVFDSVRNMHTELIKVPFKKCLLRPWHFFNRTVHSHKIVRGLFLEKS